MINDMLLKNCKVKMLMIASFYNDKIAQVYKKLCMICDRQWIWVLCNDEVEEKLGNNLLPCRAIRIPRKKLSFFSLPPSTIVRMMCEQFSTAIIPCHSTDSSVYHSAKRMCYLLGINKVYTIEPGSYEPSLILKKEVLRNLPVQLGWTSRKKQSKDVPLRKKWEKHGARSTVPSNEEVPDYISIKVNSSFQPWNKNSRNKEVRKRIVL